MPNVDRIEQCSGAVGEIQSVLRKCRNATKYCHIYKERNVIAGKGPVKLIKQGKIAHSFLQSMSNQFHVIILSLPM